MPTLRLPRKKLKHDKQWLALAYEIYESTGHYILNPRHIETTSLQQADVEWTADLNRYAHGLNFYRDLYKR